MTVFRLRCDACKRRRCQDCDGEAYNSVVHDWVTCGCEHRARGTLSAQTS